MSAIVRHESITLLPGVEEALFVNFMQSDLLPFFEATYTKLTRISSSNLISQQLLKHRTRPGRYIWVSSWQGNPEAISHRQFKGLQVTNMHELPKNDMLQRMRLFAKRTTAGIYDDLQK